MSGDPPAPPEGPRRLRHSTVYLERRIAGHSTRRKRQVKGRTLSGRVFHTLICLFGALILFSIVASLGLRWSDRESSNTSTSSVDHQISSSSEPPFASIGDDFTEPLDKTWFDTIERRTHISDNLQDSSFFGQGSQDRRAKNHAGRQNAEARLLPQAVSEHASVAWVWFTQPIKSVLASWRENRRVRYRRLMDLQISSKAIVTPVETSNGQNWQQRPANEHDIKKRAPSGDAPLSAINTAKPSTELTRLISFVRSMDQSPQAIRHLASLYPNATRTRIAEATEAVLGKLAGERLDLSSTSTGSAKTAEQSSSPKLAPKLVFHRQHLSDLIGTPIMSMELYLILADAIASSPTRERPAILTGAAQQVFAHPGLGPFVSPFPDAESLTPSWYDVSIWLPDAWQLFLQGEMPSQIWSKPSLSARLARLHLPSFGTPTSEAIHSTKQQRINPWDVRFTAHSSLARHGYHDDGSSFTVGSPGRLRPESFAAPARSQTSAVFALRSKVHFLPTRLLRLIHQGPGDTLLFLQKARQHLAHLCLSVPRVLSSRLGRWRRNARSTIFALTGRIIQRLSGIVDAFTRSVAFLLSLAIACAPIRQIAADIASRKLRPFRASSWRAFRRRLSGRNPFSGSLLHLVCWTSYYLLAACIVVLRFQIKVTAPAALEAVSKIELPRVNVSAKDLAPAQDRLRATANDLARQATRLAVIAFKYTTLTATTIIRAVYHWLHECFMRPALRRALHEVAEDNHDLRGLLAHFKFQNEYKDQQTSDLKGAQEATRRYLEYHQHRVETLEGLNQSLQSQLAQSYREHNTELSSSLCGIAAKHMWVWIRHRENSRPSLKCMPLDSLDEARRKGNEITLPDPDLLLESLRRHPALGFYESCQWLGRHFWECKMRRGGWQFGPPGEVEDVPTTLATFLGAAGDHRPFQGIIHLPHSAGQTLSFEYQSYSLPDNSLGLPPPPAEGTMTMHFTSSHPFIVRSTVGGAPSIMPLLVQAETGGRPQQQPAPTMFDSGWANSSLPRQSATPANQVPQPQSNVPSTGSSGYTGLSALDRITPPRIEPGTPTPAAKDANPPCLVFENLPKAASFENLPKASEAAEPVSTSSSFETTSSTESFLYGPGRKANPAVVSDSAPFSWTPVPLATAPRSLLAGSVYDSPTPQTGMPAIPLVPSPSTTPLLAQDIELKTSTTPAGTPPDGLALSFTTPTGPPPEHLAPEHLAPEHLAPEHLAPEHLAPEHLAPEPSSTPAVPPPATQIIATSTTPAGEPPAVFASNSSTTPVGTPPAGLELEPSTTPADSPSQAPSLAERLGIMLDLPPVTRKEEAKTTSTPPRILTVPTLAPEPKLTPQWSPGIWTAEDDRDLDFYLAQANEATKSESKASNVDTTLVGFDADDKLDADALAFFSKSGGEPANEPAKALSLSLRLPPPTAAPFQTSPLSGLLDTPSPIPRRQLFRPKPSNKSSALFNTSASRRDSNLRQQIGTQMIETSFQRNQQEAAAQAEEAKREADEIIRVEQAFLKKIGKSKAPIEFVEGSKRNRLDFEGPRDDI